MDPADGSKGRVICLLQSLQPSKNPKGSYSINDHSCLTFRLRQIAEADLATQARNTASQAAKGIQTGTKIAADRFNNFVEDSGGAGGSGGGGGGSGSRAAVAPERKDFWDSFGEPEQKAGSIGTAAMRKGGGGGGGGQTQDEKWDNW